MSGLFAILRFELRRRLRMLSTWVYFAVFFALAVLSTLAAGGALGNASVSFGSEKVWANAPMALMTVIGLLSVLALPVVSSLWGRAVQQDFEFGTYSAFFSAPISKAQYLGGRFAAALLSIVLVIAAVGLGIAFTVHLPVLDSARVGNVGILAYLWPYGVMVIPNAIILGAIFFSMGALTRRMLPVYVTSAILLVGYLVASELTSELSNRLAASLLDPFGITAILSDTEYWPVAERNTELVPMSGYLLWNRLLWLGAALAVLAMGYRRFRFAHVANAGGARGKPDEDGEAAPPRARWRPVAPGRPRWHVALAALTWLQFKETVKNVYFGVILLTGLLFVVTSTSNLGALYGTNTYPVTHKMLELVGGQFGIFVLILVTFYSGELVWRERDLRIDQICDAMPVPTAVTLASKLLALMMVPVLVQGVVLLTGVGVQLVKGYTHLELGLYLRHLFAIQLLNIWGICALAFTVQVVVNHKYVGHFAMVLYFVVATFGSSFGLEHTLLQPFRIGVPVYSDMNGFGHLLARVRWLQLFWGCVAIALVALARLLWQRGTVVGWRSRLAVARTRLSRPVQVAAVLAVVGAAGSGAFILHNLHGLNRYQSTAQLRHERASYERLYRARLLDKPQPKITAVKVQVELFPSQQRARGTGTFTLTNKTTAPIEELWINLGDPSQLTSASTALDVPASLLLDEPRFALRAYKLATPLAPGAAIALRFDATVAARGFRNGAPFTEVVHNGSFINSRQLFPTLGYSEESELSSDADRRREGLAAKERMRPRDDPSGVARSYLSADSDWLTFEAVVSTEPDQLAIAPGYLQREWLADGRRYFEYKMDSPILNFYAFLSARYQVRRDRWGDVAIEIYYHPGHEYNLDRMIASAKDSLTYFTKAFGPYQHRQFRVLEFPRYASFAQAFPNTIPYSEAIGFVARVDDDDPEDLDYPYYITAHELAHQWWAHQVIGGNVQGATMLSETLSQYSALMVMKRKYGDAKMKRFLRYELDRYLGGRTREQKKEVPLALVEGQPYIHYNKGSLVMYALQDYLGEDRVNAVLKSFRDAAAYRGPPYPTSAELVRAFEQAAPAELRELVSDLFGRIVLFENRALQASARALPGGTYQVTLKVRAKKVRADELGAETEEPLREPVELGVFNATGAPLHLAKHRLAPGDNEVTLTVAGRPARAGIDPLNKLIDRTPSDNVVDVDL